MFLTLLAPLPSDASYYLYTTICGIFIIAMFVAAIAAIILVLLQPSNSDGMDALSGGSSDTFYGKNKGQSTEAVLKKWTIVCLVVLAVLAIAFFIIKLVW